MNRLSIHNLAGLGRWGWMRLLHPRTTAGLFFVDRRARVRLGRGGRLEVGRGTILSKDFTAEIGAPARVGANAFFDPGCHVVVTEGLEIGDDALIWEYVTIDDSQPPGRHETGRRAIRIGDRVSIGPRATILAGVSIGEGCIIGAHALVTDDLPPNSVAVGVPARVVRTLRAHPPVASPS